jgi:ketosteroid isomerase-like protein
MQAIHDAAITRELEFLVEQLASTWRQRDCEGWGALIADDWSVTHIDAQVITKPEALEMCRTGPPVSTAVDQLRVRVYGDTAIVTGRTKAAVTGSTPQVVVLRFTDVFVRREGRWVVVASHATRVAE